MKISVQKKDVTFELEVKRNTDIAVYADGKFKVCAYTITDKALVFPYPIVIVLDGKKTEVRGLLLEADVLNSIKAEQEKIKAAEKKAKEDEKAAMLNGEKPLEISYHDGEILSGYTAYGITEEILEENFCGKYVSGWGFLIDEEFKDGDIKKILAHGQEVKAAVEAKAAAKKAEKDADYKGVENWVKKSEAYNDECGKTYAYYHTITINGKTYKFCEDNVFDCGIFVKKISGNDDADAERCRNLIKKYGDYAHATIRM